jgi:hypothetical protein
MQKQLIAAGRLIGTSDAKMAARIGQLVKIEARPGQRVRRDLEPGAVILTLNNEVYELQAA